MDSSPLTRLWTSSDNCTMVQYRTDLGSPSIWIHNNLGWCPVSTDCMDNPEEVATSLAANWNLVEADPATAMFFAGLDEDESQEIED